MAAAKTDYSSLIWLAVIGGGLWCLSRLNATAPANANRSSIQSDEAAAASGRDQTWDAETIVDPAPGPQDPRFTSGHIRVPLPPIRDEVTLPRGQDPNDHYPPPYGYQWWAPDTGSAGDDVTWYLERVGTYHAATKPGGVWGTGWHDDREPMNPFYT